VSKASLRNKKDFETRLLHSQRLRFKVCKTYITAIFFLKLCENKNQRWSFQAAADAADKGTVSYTVFVARRSYQSGIFAMVLKWNIHHD